LEATFFSFFTLCVGSPPVLILEGKSEFHQESFHGVVGSSRESHISDMMPKKNFGERSQGHEFDSRWKQNFFFFVALILNIM
jgi:hypothetical protein